MSLVDAVRNAGLMPADSAPQAEKKAYSERLSRWRSPKGYVVWASRG